VTTPRVSNRYPRQGERIAPSTLREFLMEPIPRRIVGKSVTSIRQLCDLDETAWEQFSPEAIAELSRIVVNRVAACQLRNVFQHRHFPRPDEGTRLEDLRLENRTRRCLARAGFEDSPGALGDHTIGEVMDIRAFGPRCLVDLLAALESPRRSGDKASAGEPRSTSLSAELTAAAQRLAEVRGAESALLEDPRFGDSIRAVDVEATTAVDLAERLMVRKADPPDAPYAAEQVRSLCEKIERMSELTLEDELIQIFAPTGHHRNRQIVIGYYGWADGRQHTLTEIGDQFGITRERVRQVCAKATRKPKNIETIVAPAMDRAVALIERRIPVAAEEIEAELTKQGLTAAGMCLENVAVGATLLERSVALRIVKIEACRMAVHPDQVAPAMAIVDLAKKDLYFHGLGTVEKIEKLTAQKFPGCTDRELVVRVIGLIEGFSWLDERSGWFHVRSIAKHGMPKAVQKILSVAGEVSISQMRTAMSRNRRMWKDPPPAGVLLEFCRQMPGVRVEGNRIAADPPLDWKEMLTGVEYQLVRVLKDHGPVMERGAMEDLCVESGMNRFSFHAFVSWSPVIAQFGHSVYGLLGATVSKKRLHDLIKKRRSGQTARRVLDSHGRTEDGKVWLSYRLSKAASTYAVITVPAALKNEVHGHFRLLNHEGDEIGTLATKDGRAWGLGAFLRQNGVKINDRIVLTLDLEKRTASVMLIDEGV